jgi:oligoendopeptidase F
MFSNLPKSYLHFKDWTWEQFRPYAEDLIKRTISASTVTRWLTDWSDISRIVSEIYQRLYVAVTVDTTDGEAKSRYNAFLEDIFPAAQAADQALKEKLLASGLEPEGFEKPLRNMRAEAAIYREVNLPLLSEEFKLSSKFDGIIGAQTVMIDGKELTIAQLQPIYQDTDRGVRERTWRLASEREFADRQALNDLWVQLMDVRRQLAVNADFSDYRAYRWQQLLRFDYTPQDCFSFHRAIEEVVVPVALRIYEKRRQRLGLTTLRPWDLNVDILGRQPLRPYQTADELVEKVSTIFQHLDPQLGRYFESMRRQGLLDVENRKGKAPGAYCTNFDVVRLPFIFENAVGVHEDVMTLLHEAGHAFHVFETAYLPYHAQLAVGMEFGEVASTAMELLTSPYLLASEGGFYSQADMARARIEHLESIILFWPYMAVVDAFQHWVYENHEIASDPQHCDAKWRELWERFMRGVDWSGLDDFLMTGWQRKLHIFQVPFYYVEYGLASLGAMQVWRNSLTDQAGAVAAYRRALSLGGTVSIPKLYEAAGVKFAFDAVTLGEVVKLAEETIEKLEKQAE